MDKINATDRVITELVGDIQQVFDFRQRFVSLLVGGVPLGKRDRYRAAFGLFELSAQTPWRLSKPKFSSALGNRSQIDLRIAMDYDKIEVVFSFIEKRIPPSIACCSTGRFLL